MTLESLEERVVLSNWIGPIGGSWFTPANWSAGVPTATEPAVIGAGATVNIDAAGAVAKSITIGASTLNLGSNDLTVNDEFDATAATITSAAGSTLTLAGGDHSAFDAPGATFQNVVINKGPTTTLTLDSDMLVKGTFTITQLANLNGPGSVLAEGDVVTNDTAVNGSALIEFVGGGTQNLNAGVADAQVPGVEVNKPSGVLKIGATTLDLRRGWKQVSSAATVNAAGSTIVLAGNDHRTIDGNGVLFNNVVVDMGSTSGLTIASTNFDVGGTFTIDEIGYFAGSGGGRVNAYKNVVANDTTVGSFTATGTIAFVGSTGQHVVLGVDGAQLPSVVIAKTGGTLYIPAGNLGITGNWTYVSGGLSFDNNSIITFESKTHLMITSGGNAFRNVVIQLVPTATLNADGPVNVHGSLTINEVGAINPDFIVKGHVASNDGAVGGAGKIVMVNGVTTANLTGGDFPNGGVEINRPGASVNANVTTPMDGPLKIVGMNQLAGLIKVANNVITSTTTQSGGSGVIDFVGTGNQSIITQGTGGRLPNVNIDKPSGVLTMDAPAARPLTITGNWTHVNGAVNASNSLVVFIAGPATGVVDADGMWFNDVAINRSGATLDAKHLNVGRDLTLGASVGTMYIKGLIKVGRNLHSDTQTVGDNAVITLVSDTDSVVSGLDLPSGGLVVQKGLTSNTTVKFEMLQAIDAPLTLDGPKLFVYKFETGVPLETKSDLKLLRAANINRPILVNGNVLVATTTNVGGAGSIQMVGNNNATIKAENLGDFPNGNATNAGFVVNKSGGKKVTLLSDLLVPSFNIAGGTLDIKTFSLTTGGTGTTYFGRLGAGATLEMTINASNYTTPRVLLNAGDSATVHSGINPGVFTYADGTSTIKVTMSGVSTSSTPVLISANDFSGSTPSPGFDLPTGWYVIQSTDTVPNPDRKLWTLHHS